MPDKRSTVVPLLIPSMGDLHDYVTYNLPHLQPATLTVSLNHQNNRKYISRSDWQCNSWKLQLQNNSYFYLTLGIETIKKNNENKKTTCMLIANTRIYGAVVVDKMEHESECKFNSE